MTKRRKHIPQRTCVGCRTVLAKRELIRLVRTSEGVLVDPTGKQAGRGAYLHNQRSCWELGLKTGLERALRTTLTPANIEQLTQYMLTLPEDSSG
ncbi:MAG TPA: YlxR family protein [Anaerolineales bacterium]|nr:YlxR family protein [Anaerolineales bacterium]